MECQLFALRVVVPFTLCTTSSSPQCGQAQFRRRKCVSKLSFLSLCMNAVGLRKPPGNGVRTNSTKTRGLGTGADVDVEAGSTDDWRCRVRR
jgi:hypothetical protein